MRLTKFFAVFVALVGRICLSQIIIDTKNLDELAEVETAALRVLKKCYGNRDKTIILAGDFPGNFVKKLSGYQNFSVVLLDSWRRAENNIFDWSNEKPQSTHKGHILVMIASFVDRLIENLQTYMNSQYYTGMSSVLILGWSPRKKNAICSGKFQTLQILYNVHFNNFLYTNLICRHRTEGIMIYGSNGFTNDAPKPWRLAWSSRIKKEENVFFSFGREYRDDDDGMCEHFFFDKTRDLNGQPIRIFYHYNAARCMGKLVKDTSKNRRVRIDKEKLFSYIRDFITYVNATQLIVCKKLIVGDEVNICADCLSAIPVHMRGVMWNTSFAYPYTIDCKYLLTQFRGNKSQLKKIYDIIDSYSWVGVWLVYFITLIFFKCFLHQTLIEGLLNICRLTCNLGLTTSPRDLASRIYFVCLLFYVVTMLGIFTGNLASLLTHDIPVRQVNSIRDIIELNYTVYADITDFRLIKTRGFKGRLIKTLKFESCVPYVKRHRLAACLTWGVDSELATNSKLQASNCIAKEYFVHVIPAAWYLEEKINKFILIKIGGGFMTDLDVIVDEKRLLEAKSKKVVLDPEIMTFADLGFAFAIFGVGLGCSVINFMVEIMIYRFQRRVTTTRVIVLN